MGRCGFEREYVRIERTRSIDLQCVAATCGAGLLSSHLALGLFEQCHAASRMLTDCNE